ncbi:Acetyl esterase/lipase [Propionibacterium cyclohexanicum]|mgnify:FL=1|uniref:Acetyl esterase/lipase n=1 Tax=Propionibacterium cyclohexanicum TaxID=64702 RepID=A0A1H9PQR2_9ACTN|nr:alpha/beta hydrolase [Propionibacterium cyclohexanicum]SER50544.1 Acetyl esterase/lipase [Propionibacterium cyclohexanicum]
MPRCEVSFRIDADRDADLGLAVAIAPGGAYEMIADHEGEPVARWFASVGVSAAVLDYPVGQRHPAPFDAAMEAFDELRRQPSWRGRTVGIAGFSAGGHLAAMCSTPQAYGCAAVPPAFSVLGYPVIAMDAQGHELSTANLLGPTPDDATRTHFSVDTVVGAATPPAFIWHTADDPSVPVSHSLRYTAACRRAGVPVELHVFEHGAHGLGLAEHSQAEPWPGLCARWLARRAGASHPGR